MEKHFQWTGFRGAVWQSGLMVWSRAHFKGKIMLMMYSGKHLTRNKAADGCLSYPTDWLAARVSGAPNVNTLSQSGAWSTGNVPPTPTDGDVAPCRCWRPVGPEITSQSIISAISNVREAVYWVGDSYVLPRVPVKGPISWKIEFFSLWSCVRVKHAPTHRQYFIFCS